MADGPLLNRSLSLLNIIGLHPEKSSGLFSLLRRASHMTLNVVYWSLITIELIVKWHGVESLGDGLEIIVGVFQTVIKCAIMIILRDEIIDALEDLKKIWPTTKFGVESQEELDGVHSSVEAAFGLLRKSVIAACIFYSTKPVVMKKRIYPVGIYAICDIEDDVCYGINTFNEVFLVILMGIATVGFDGVFFGFLSNIFCQFRIIKVGFLQLKTTDNEMVLMQEFDELVIHHNFILQLFEKINKIYSNFLLTQFATSLLDICVCIVFLLIDGFPPALYRISRSVPMLVMFIVQLYIYCLSGERIAEECEGIANAAYESDWLNIYQPKYRKKLCFVIQKAQIRTHLSAGGLFGLDMKTFIGIMQKSVSLFMVIQQLHDTEFKK